MAYRYHTNGDDLPPTITTLLTYETILDRIELACKSFELKDIQAGVALVQALRQGMREDAHFRKEHNARIKEREENRRKKKAARAAKNQAKHLARQAGKPDPPKITAPKRPKYKMDRKASPRLEGHVQSIGYESYSDYIHSPHWKSVRERYIKAWPDCRCIVCGNVDFRLHHIHYSRLGREDLHDLLPLCDKHHKQLHKAHADRKLPIAEYREGLQAAFGWSLDDLAKRLETYHAMRPR